MVINCGNWALWANHPHVSQVKLTFQIFDSILRVLLTLRSFCILIPLCYVTWSQIKFVDHIFSGVTFGNSPKWHGLPGVRSTGSTVREPQTAPKTFLTVVLWEWSGLTLGPLEVSEDNILVLLLSTCSALVRSVFENFAVLWCHCSE